MPSYPTIPALRSGLDAQLGAMTDFTRRTSDAMRKFNELHLQYAQQVMQDVTDASRAIINCSDPFQAAAALASCSKPATEHLLNYQQQVFGVLSGVQLELGRSAEAFVPHAVSAAGAERSHAGNGSRYTPS
ncbi:MAG: phasin family protein [Pseudomonadota bacterium]